jgi:hypothetical protein
MKFHYDHEPMEDAAVRTATESMGTWLRHRLRDEMPQECLYLSVEERPGGRTALEGNSGLVL